MKYFKTYNELKESLNKATEYAVMLIGGSIGDKSRPRDSRGYIGVEMNADETLYSKTDAKETAKRMNKGLSPSERSYYGLKYVVVPVSNGKFVREAEDLDEAITMDAVFIHSITGSGQDGAQNFIDDNKLDGKKIADYLKANKNEKYNIRDLIAGTGIGAQRSYRQRMLKLFKESLNEREYSNDQRTDMADKGLALPDGSFPIKDLEDLKNAIQAYGRSKDQTAAAKFIAKRAKELSAEDLIPVSDDFQKSLKESMDFEKLKVGSILNFTDGETWKITKIVGNPSNPRGVFAKADGDTKKSYISVALEFSIDELVNNVVSINEELIKEATTSWSKMMKGVKSSETGPWSLVAIENLRVVGQSIDIRTQDLVPAKYEALRKDYPRANIYIEDGTGMVIWSSNK